MQIDHVSNCIDCIVIIRHILKYLKADKLLQNLKRKNINKIKNHSSEYMEFYSQNKGDVI